MTKQNISGRSAPRKPGTVARKAAAIAFADDAELADEIARAAIRKAEEAATAKRSGLSTDEFVQRLAPRLLQDMQGRSLREIALAVTDAIDDAVKCGKLNGRTPKPATIERSLAQARKAMPKTMSEDEIDATIDWIAERLRYTKFPTGPDKIVPWLRSARRNTDRALEGEAEVISAIDDLLAVLAPSPAQTGLKR